MVVTVWAESMWLWVGYTNTVMFLYCRIKTKTSLMFQSMCKIVFRTDHVDRTLHVFLFHVQLVGLISETQPGLLCFTVLCKSLEPSLSPVSHFVVIV